MTDDKTLVVIMSMHACLNAIQSLKENSEMDARSLSVAATYLETAMLWVANARKDE